MESYRGEPRPVGRLTSIRLCATTGQPLEHGREHCPTHYGTCETDLFHAQAALASGEVVIVREAVSHG